VDGEQGPDGAKFALTVTPSPPEVPPTREAPDGDLAAAVDEAVIGDVFADLPEAQPDRQLTSATDVSSLYVRHRSGMAAHARRFLRDQRDVDEVVQETFLRLFLAIGEIETELQAIAFARRTLTNLCIDRYRADRRRPMLVNLEAAPVGELAEDDSDNDPVLQAEDAAIVREALARLSPLHRAALVKREIEEKPLAQIAAELEIPEESVKHLLFRARRALRRLLVGTSVEPGVDLTAGEVVSIANRRAGEALMRGANVFIVIVVGAIVAAVGMRALEGRTPVVSASTGAVDQGQAVAGGTTASKSVHPRHAVALHQLPQRAAQHNSVADTPDAPTIAPVQQAPIKGSSTAGSTFGTSRSHLKLSGPLHVTGAPRIEGGGSTLTDGGATVTSASSFSADTNVGTFQLAQMVSASPVVGDTVSVTPSFVVGNVVETPDMTGSTASVSTAADGAVNVSVVAGATPDVSTNAFPMTSMSVHLVLTPDLASVLSETVVLSTTPPATTPTAPPTATGPTGSGPPVDTPPFPFPTAGTSPTGTAGGTGSGTPDGGDTSSGSTPGSQAATPGMLEISDKFEDDRALVRAFSTFERASS
jgi:RNA polymerase sigma factor (sigma-70 family)